MANNKQQPPPPPSPSPLSHQQHKNDKKQRKLTKSPQVSCDISMLSSSPTLYGLSSTSSFSFASPKYIAYPSSLPNHHYDDECLMKNFEYLRSDLSLTSEQPNTTVPSPILLCGSNVTTTSTAASSKFDAGVVLPPSPKMSDDVTNSHHYPSVTPKSAAVEPQHHGMPESLFRNNDGDIDLRPCVVAIMNPLTIPACCLKSSHGAGGDGTNRHHPTLTPAATAHHQPPTPHIQTSPLSSAPSILNEQLRHIKQMFQSSSSSTLTSTSKDESGGGGGNINHHNPFTFGNIFKSCDKSATISPQIGTPQKPSLLQSQPNKTATHASTPIQTSAAAPSAVAAATTTSSSLAATSTCGNNSLLTENVKRDEFLKATMKICLVVSPPSNKLLQLKSKSLTHLDALESHIGTQTECLTPKPIGDYLEVENSGNTICCLSSPSPSSSSSIKNKSPSLNSSNKKPILTRSQVSSSEYFCVYYDVENEFKEKEEFIPAIKGITLADALHDALCSRNLSFSQITISDNNFPSSMDLGSPPYSGGVNQNTDVGNLAGKFLIVTEKNKTKKSGHALQKAASFGARQRPAKLFQSASTEETTELGDAAKVAAAATAAQLLTKQPKQRWSGLFGLRNPQQNQLCEMLNTYAKMGVPRSRQSYAFDHIDLVPALDYLENVHSSWMEFVCYPDMTDGEIKIQSAIWELVTTEVDYIHALQTVTDLFLACLEAIQVEHILNDVDQNKLFSNIRDICEANIKFWTMYIYPMVRHSVNTGHPMCIDYFSPGFVTFASTFAPYKKYCAEQSTCQFYCRELHRNNAIFQAYLAWCEAQKLCNRLRLADILVRPMQRLTKYSLLLGAVRKHLTDENDGEIMDAMVHSVENFVCSVNSHLTARQENERLNGIMARIESYDVVDTNNEHLDKLAKQYSSMFDLCGPMKGCAATQGRHLFMEGDLRFKDSSSKADVHCFLLTDMLLVCKTIAKKGLGTLKVIRQPFITDRLVIKVKDNTLYAVYLNEFNVAVAAFSLQCTEAKSWHDAITKAKHIYSRLKQGSTWDGYNIKYASGNNEMLGVRKSPLNSSIGSRVSSLNNSHSGSVELTESKTVSIDYEKANSLSSDEGVSSLHGVGSSGMLTKKVPQNSPTKPKGATSANTLVVQPLLSLGQSLPNLNISSPHTSNNTLLVPGASSSSGHSNLLSPSHRGISYPPPSPTRATLRRGFAFSSSIKNPPLLKSRNITSQNSFNLPPAVIPPTQSATTSAAIVLSPTSTAVPQALPLSVNIEEQIQNSNESDV